MKDVLGSSRVATLIAAYLAAGAVIGTGGVARGDFLVTSSFDDKVVRFRDNGSLVGDFVKPGSGGLNSPFAMSWGPDGELYVAEHSAIRVYSHRDGEFIRQVPYNNFPNMIHGLLFAPNGDLLVSSGSTTGGVVPPFSLVDRIDPFTGALRATIGEGVLQTPGKMILAPNGRVLVGNNRGDASKEVYALDLATNSVAGIFTADARISGAFGFDYGPDGILYSANLYGTPGVYRMNATTGQVVGEFHTNVPGFAADVLCVPGNAMWVVGLVSGELARFDRTTGEYLYSVAAPGFAYDLLHMPDPTGLSGVLALGVTLRRRPARRPPKVSDAPATHSIAAAAP